MTDKKTLTTRELNIIYDKVADKVVDRICNQLINGYTVSNTLKKKIEDSMVKILNDTSISHKLGDIILQNVDVLFRDAVKGPHLLYTLLSNNNTYKRVKQKLLRRMEELTIIDGKINMRDISKQLFNKPIHVKKGGKKTLRKKIIFRNNKNKTRVFRGGDGNKPELEQLLGVALENSDKIIDGIKPAPNNTTTEPAPAPNNTTINNTTINDVDALFSNYVESLINQSSKNIVNMSNNISNKMINATYNYMLKNGDSIIKATHDGIVTQFNKIPINIVDIIIDQVLYDSKDILSESIQSIITDKEKTDKNFKFEPKNIVNDVLNQTKIIIERR